MLASYSHRFLFFHLYKVAGSSIRKALGPFQHLGRLTSLLRSVKAYGHVARLMPTWPSLHRFRLFPYHISPRVARTQLPREIFEGFFKFAFVRNPWDWQVSLYYYVLSDRWHRQHRLVRSLGSFERYIEWRVAEDRQLQTDFFCDTSGALLVDFLGRYERLGDDFAIACERIGLRAELPHLNRSDHRPYRSYYSDSSAALVGEAFAEDISRFSYTF